ncbi:succinate dehydrogenase, cytochrome b556 subunit [Gammaproteobacteria bacterium]|jgi:succinate dehydrogenase / fumarate reductase cytochrome b subunit|nr:succinate dehydrogenase, cytochrome b556 subunit [Gammaproteobacteria bacterium]MDC0440756.1 succinate dehydrogenase, cytochrome b556 subunit [Gammaproteobacteria bacterium]MDC0442834.1 succinate dehydrogenase, cytochrome b556 subunit [Gammaproteobacteria bacterium]MDC0885107.1 succinate dehydrogenase, cytochrome b556 subunit [Gammaproteobacteria bacterium]|tara:strand:+ start:76 stop:456 length:381 start_codon:yes stop_codon:yes gene_type:complete
MSIKPVYINLFKIQLPLSALLSISHRVSGILIFFLVLPVSAYILNLLLASQDSFSSFVDVFNSSVFLRTFVLFNILIFEYHVIAGIRHMLMDFKLVSETLSASNTSAITALIVFFVIALLTILGLI